jgi:CHAT domain-containing protein/Tfp pilus assembly protein PilF
MDISSMESGMNYKIILLCTLFLYSSLYADDYSRANALFEEGAQLYQEGSYKDALKFFIDAELIYNTLDKDQNLSAYTNLWSGITYKSLFDYNSAVSNLKKSIKQAAKQGLTEVLLSAYSNLADSYYSVDNWSDAYETYQTALKIALKNNGIQYYPVIYEGIGNIKFAWGKYDDAEASYNTAMIYAQQQNIEESIIKIKMGYAGIEHARNNLQSSIEIYEKLLDRPNIIISKFYISIINSLGTVYFKSGKIETALEYYNQALSLAPDQENILEKIRLYIHIGGAYHILEKYEDALSFYSLALPLTELYNRDGDRSICLYNIGLAYFFLANFELAVSYFKDSIKIKEVLRLSAQGKDRLDYLTEEVHVYQWLSSSYLEMEKYEEAITAIESSSAKYLIEQLQYGNQDYLTFYGTDLIQEKLKSNELIIKFAGASTPRHSVFTISKKILRGEFLFPEDLISQFDNRELDFFNKLKKTRSDSFYKATENISLEIDQFLFDDIINYYRMLLISRININHVNLIGRFLYNYLITPIENNLELVDKIIIIPDGILAFLPFETLIMPDGRYLIEKYDISYVQSLAVSEIINSRTIPRNRKDFIGFGGADYLQFNSSSHNTKYRSLNIGSWNNLPGTVSEIKDISSLYNSSDYFLNTELNETLIKSMSENNELKQYKIIHFATHGLVLPEIPDLSALVLTNDGKFNEDGYLNVSEISNLKIAADFVNLSACETGLGKIYGGEGVVGLAQAFLIAGANSLSVSLWQVADEATREFMVGFYTLVSNGNYNYNQAMSAMKRKFIKSEDYSNPFYWAPFIFFGD